MNAQWQARFAEKMRGEGLPEIAIDAFVRSLGFLGEARETLIAETDLSPVEDVPAAQHLERFEARGRQAVSQAAVIKLNGGLGTSMGLSRSSLAMAWLMRRRSHLITRKLTIQSSS
jgi:UTP--glucose-1-phosphate uridylyltransferase